MTELPVCEHRRLRWDGKDSGGTYYVCLDCDANLVAEEWEP